MAISQPTYPVTTSALVTHVGSYTDTQDAAKAPLASPTFTGVPAAPTAALGTNTTQLATMAALLAAIVAASRTTISAKTGSYTTVAADANTLLTMTSASATVFTIAPGLYTVGDTLEFARFGAGTVTITPGAGVTIPNSIEEAGTTSRTISARRLSAVATMVSANVWWLTGGIA